MPRFAYLALAGMLVFTACARKKHSRTAPVPPPPSLAGSVEEGIASWYGHPYHGRPAASGEIYDMEQMTAAHRTLPLGTWVRVDNLNNHKTVDVRINDRGPFVDGRIIDLSHAAARAIGMLGPGTARVRVTVLRSTPAVSGHFAVQVGAFRERANAERLRRQMESRYGAARLLERADSPGMWRVLVGDEPSEAAAQGLVQRIRRDLGARTAAFVVRIDS